MYRIFVTLEEEEEEERKNGDAGGLAISLRSTRTLWPKTGPSTQKNMKHDHKEGHVKSEGTENRSAANMLIIDCSNHLNLQHFRL
jgi:hypothetical protein